jgi:hypothetical protein
MASKKKVLTEHDALHTLGAIAGDAIMQSDIDAPTGSCVYTTSSGAMYCAVLTEAYCNKLHGTWSEGEPCPAPAS